MRLRIFLLTALLLGIGSFAARPASAGPSCGTPDEHLNLVPTSIWYGSNGCYGVAILWLPPQLCPAPDPLVDRPYAEVIVSACGAVVLLQP